jgi:hypothetical protein
VAKLTSEISSSPRKNSWGCEVDGKFAVPSLVEADAPLASARDTLAIPNAGNALLRRLFFEERFDMAQSPIRLGEYWTNR